MCDKAILEHGGTLESVPDCYKNQEIYDKAVNNYLHALRFVPDSYITQKMSDKYFNTYHSTIQFVPDCYQEMFVKAIYIYIYVYIYREILENFVIWKLDIVQNLCDFCQFFFVWLFGTKVPNTRPKCVPWGKMS